MSTTEINVPSESNDDLPDGWKMVITQDCADLYDPNGGRVIHNPVCEAGRWHWEEYRKSLQRALIQAAHWKKNDPKHMPIESDPVALRNEIRRLRALLEEKEAQ